MTAFARTDHSIFGKWWWTVDRWTLAVLAVLMGLGIVLVQAAVFAIAFLVSPRSGLLRRPAAEPAEAH